MAKAKVVKGARKRRFNSWLKNITYALLPLIGALLVRWLFSRNIVEVFFSSSELLVFALINSIVASEEVDDITSDVTADSYFTTCRIISVFVIFTSSITYGITLLEGLALEEFDRLPFVIISALVAVLSTVTSYLVQKRIGEIEEPSQAAVGTKS